ncbi:uncharacterized protein PpBr36_11354 [Pyricularia pennisetigena]|uniref:uncharacterized protein n=1 Tax=Pyricularia pennisetigena TaxID=1578925 RepID=UPI0011537FAB|nr:uncharacterized protein PpBr36_11354 [Pyricularia pennisetigena]TLS20476.1 hypothetical protein PpBr36_11354 [Pyricularia pennisetigena]
MRFLNLVVGLYACSAAIANPTKVSQTLVARETLQHFGYWADTKETRWGCTPPKNTSKNTAGKTEDYIKGRAM